MRWPWQRGVATTQWILSWSGGVLTYVHAKRRGDRSFEVLALGVEGQGTDDAGHFRQRLQALGLKGADATMMLRSDQYQLLQIDTPNVPVEELRAAARYQVREMLQTHVDDVTIDVMRVGDGQQKGTGHSFVVAATNAVVKDVLDFAVALECRVSVIDIQETAQRNLQTALAQRDGSLARASAALVLSEGQQAVLTICANGELFYNRRFDVPSGFLIGRWSQGVAEHAPIDGFTPVQEYVPAYGVGDISLDLDIPRAEAFSVADQHAASSDDDQSQRLLLEVQRSLDVWDRTFSSLPLTGLLVFAGERSAELAIWLTRQLGQVVVPLDVKPIFSGLESVSTADLTACLPLLGVLLRTEESTL
jgi:MSHA biogenesis protein MshI